MEIRPGRRDDLEAIGEIYDHYVLHSDTTFDEAPSTEEERLQWFDTFGATGGEPGT